MLEKIKKTLLGLVLSLSLMFASGVVLPQNVLALDEGISSSEVISQVEVDFEVKGKSSVFFNNKIKVNEGTTVLDALKGIDELNIDESGGFVKSINGEANKGSSGWMYSVNGEVPNVLSNEIVLKDGDSVQWYYSERVMLMMSVRDKSGKELFANAQTQGIDDAALNTTFADYIKTTNISMVFDSNGHIKSVNGVEGDTQGSWVVQLMNFSDYTKEYDDYPDLTKQIVDDGFCILVSWDDEEPYITSSPEVVSKFNLQIKDDKNVLYTGDFNITDGVTIKSVLESLNSDSLKIDIQEGSWGPYLVSINGNYYDGWVFTVNGEWVDTNIVTTVLKKDDKVLVYPYIAPTHNVTIGDETQEVKDWGQVTKPTTDPVKDLHVFEGYFVGDKEYDFSSYVTEDVNIETRFRHFGILAEDSQKEVDSNKNLVIKAEGGKKTEKVDGKNTTVLDIAKVCIDDREIEVTDRYKISATNKNVSTITIQQSYIYLLNGGEHKLTLEYKDGVKVDFTFKVNKYNVDKDKAIKDGYAYLRSLVEADGSVKVKSNVWQLRALANDSNFDATNFIKYVKENAEAWSTSANETFKVIDVLVAFKQDIKDVNGFNLYEKLFSFQKDDGGIGTSAMTDAMIMEALINGGYEIKNQDKMLASLGTQNETSGLFTGNKAGGDVDTASHIYRVYKLLGKEINIEPYYNYLKNNMVDGYFKSAWGLNLENNVTWGAIITEYNLDASVILDSVLYSQLDNGGWSTSIGGTTSSAMYTADVLRYLTINRPQVEEPVVEPDTPIQPETPVEPTTPTEPEEPEVPVNIVAITIKVGDTTVTDRVETGTKFTEVYTGLVELYSYLKGNLHMEVTVGEVTYRTEENISRLLVSDGSIYEVKFVGEETTEPVVEQPTEPTVENKPEDKSTDTVVETKPTTPVEADKDLVEVDYIVLNKRGSRIYSKSLRVKEGSTVLDILKSTGLKLGIVNSQYGEYVESINGVKAFGQEGWIFYVNGTAPSHGADAHKVVDGDIVVWKWSTEDTTDTGAEDVVEVKPNKDNVELETITDDKGKPVSKENITDDTVVTYKKNGVVKSSTVGELKENDPEIYDKLTESEVDDKGNIVEQPEDVEVVKKEPISTVTEEKSSNTGAVIGLSVLGLIIITSAGFMIYEKKKD